ncbi:MAG TPA: site-2 protease family protein [Oscillospiraceae bacterium]|nr:site-2 protease family protein [Oscillospiraceae bacterium]
MLTKGLLNVGRLTVTGGFFLLLAALLCLDERGLIGTLFLLCAVHEAFHLVTILLLGGHVKQLYLTGVGAELLLDGASLSYPMEVAAALAGPAGSVMAARFLADAGALPAAGLSLALGLFNLLPARPLDGGRALYFVLAWALSPAAADRVVAASSWLCALLLCLLGVPAARFSGNFTPLLIGLWLLLLAKRDVCVYNSRRI